MAHKPSWNLSWASGKAKKCMMPKFSKPDSGESGELGVRQNYDRFL
jgi:hypothetical protein